MSDQTVFRRDDWPDGPWKDEPDIRSIQSPSGLSIELMRSPSHGYWIVYVGVEEGHPLYGLGSLDGIFVPVGAANAANVDAVVDAFERAADRADQRDRGLRQAFRTHKDLEVVWYTTDPPRTYYGFSLSRPGDRRPLSGGGGGAYRNIAFAEAQAMQLARQIDAYAAYRQRVGGPLLASRPVRSENETQVSTTDA